MFRKKTINYKGIKIKTIKQKNGDYLLTSKSEKENKKVFQLLCNDDSERFLEKMYEIVKNDGPLVYKR